MDEVGEDEDGQVLRSKQLWEREVDVDGTHKSWYSKAVQYWDQQEASYNGVLGGFGFISDVDIRDSSALMQKAFRDIFSKVSSQERVAIDCGAGVGRVTEQLLLFHFGTVDLLEPSKHLLDKAKTGLADGRGKFPPNHAPGHIFCQGLQSFVPKAHRYHCIWVQWCLLYLTDEDVVSFLQRCCSGLTDGGMVLVKENICKSGFIVDREDSSLTRSKAYFEGLFTQAGMTLIYNVKQKGMPDGLFEVRMFVLRPCAT